MGIFYVPVLIWLNENGEVIRGPENGSPSREKQELIKDWLEKGDESAAISEWENRSQHTISKTTQKALDLFEQGQELLNQGKKEETLKLWEEAFRLEPKNWLIRKQFWALKYPEKFYETGDSPDFRWQKRMLKKGE